MNLVKIFPLTALLFLTACDTTENIETASEQVESGNGSRVDQPSSKDQLFDGFG